MKLFYAPTSPYARKVLVVAHEKGLIGRLELVQVTTTPVQGDENLRAENPLGKVPTLALGDGRVLFDSRVIAAYLDKLGPLPRLNPDEGAGRFLAMTLEALADGVLDAALLCRYETMLRPPEKRWQDWLDGQQGKIAAALNSLEAKWTASLNGPLTIGAIAVGCALGYLDFRFPERDWRRPHPKLARWFEAMAERPSMKATRPA